MCLQVTNLAVRTGLSEAGVGFEAVFDAVLCPALLCCEFSMIFKYVSLHRIISCFCCCKSRDVLSGDHLAVMSVLGHSVVSVCYSLSSLHLQTLYTHIVTDIKNVNAKHKNNKVNTVSALAFMCTLN